MAKFKDAAGELWVIELDAVVLDNVRSELDVDLVDMSAGGLAEVTSDAVKLFKVLAILCMDEREERNLTTDRAFAKRIKGDAIQNAIEAVVGAVEDFFPKNDTFDIRSRWKTAINFKAVWNGVGPMMATIEKGDTPEWLKSQIAAAMMEQLSSGMENASSSSSEPDELSVGGQEDTPSTSAIDLLESAELAHVG